jgi:hypothetical protein
MDATPTVFFHLPPDEAAFVEVVLARRRELLALADTAPDGQVLARCEEAAVETARELGRRVLADGLARRIASVEKKVARSGRVRAAAIGTIAAPTTGRC